MNMNQRRCLIIFFYLFLYRGAALHHGKALYPSAMRIKRGLYSLMEPMFQNSMEDVNRLFEILLSGMQIGPERRPLLIPDQELASLRNVDKLEVLCEDVLPKTLSDIRRLLDELTLRRRPLSRRDFERTVLTLVYASQTVAQSSDQYQREAWTHTLVQLFRALQEDLRLV
ncbi:protein FAM180A [Gouania willdenowi]|uniref:Protein FAM180A-like n=1 Tax=Gouania willdenowi TaxID=441366 RepID=A0A8C5DLV1_GOUWI|nr:protein FAM180A-like [Gouania willdenowi]